MEVVYDVVSGGAAPLTRLVELWDVSRDLQRTLNVGWALIIVPNLICMAGAFFGGFGVVHSMVFNQIGGRIALGNGLTPLRKVGKVRQAKALPRPRGLATAALPAAAAGRPG